ncbi:MAG: hypothetical protein ACYTGH_14420 [Planctomycetota bacterium]|jgi:hypothetical protein
MRSLITALSLSFVFSSLVTFDLFAAEKQVYGIQHYLKENAPKASPLEALKIVSKLRKERKIRLTGERHKTEIHQLIQKVLNESGGSIADKVTKYSEITKLDGWFKLPRLQRDLLVDEFLSTDKTYTKATPKEKMKILIDLDEKLGTGASLWYPAHRTLFNQMVIETTSKLQVGDKGLAILKLISSLKKEGLTATVVDTNDVYAALTEHMRFSSKTTKMSFDAKVKYLYALEKESLIEVFPLSDYEAILFAEKLSKQDSFMKSSDDDKRAVIEKLGKDKKIHIFTTDKLKKCFGLR